MSYRSLLHVGFVLLVTSALLACPASAASITVSDHSFEDYADFVLTESWNMIGPAGSNWTWAVSGDIHFVGLYKPSAYPEAITGIDGLNIVASYFKNGGGTTEVSQVIGPLTDPGTYRLLLAIGRDTATSPSDFSYDFTTEDLYGLGLPPLARYEGSAAELTTVGHLSDFSIEYEIPVGSPLLDPGTDFMIILRQSQAGGSGLQHALFDNVRLHRARVGMVVILE